MKLGKKIKWSSLLLTLQPQLPNPVFLLGAVHWFGNHTAFFLLIQTFFQTEKMDKLFILICGFTVFDDAILLNLFVFFNLHTYLFTWHVSNFWINAVFPIEVDFGQSHAVYEFFNKWYMIIVLPYILCPTMVIRIQKKMQGYFHHTRAIISHDLCIFYPIFTTVNIVEHKLL